MKPQQGTPEGELFRLITDRILKKLSIYDIAIIRELFQPEPRYGELINTLSNQLRDDRGVMVDVLGEDACLLIEQLNIEKP